MRIAATSTIVLVLAALGCAPAPSPLGAACSASSPCPAGYECGALSGPPARCYAPCMGTVETLDECDFLEQGEGVASCNSLGACQIDCQTAADCPAPLQCPDRRLCVR